MKVTRASVFQTRLQVHAYGIHLVAVVEAGQMREAVRQQTAEMRNGILSVDQAFPMQGIQRNDKAAAEDGVRASGIREGEAVRRSPAVQILPVQLRDFRVTDKEKFHIRALRGQFLQHTRDQTAEFTGM